MYNFKILKNFDHKTFIEYLYKYENSNISKISQKTSLSRTTISNIEKGKTKPSNSTLNKISKAYPDFPFEKCGIEKEELPILAQRIRNCRKELQLEKEVVCKKIGIDKTTYTNIENGKQSPAQNTLKKLANLFNVSIAYLIGDTDIKKADNELIGKRLGIDENLIQLMENYEDINIYGKKADKDIKNDFGFSLKDISNYILADINFAEVFYIEALRYFLYCTNSHYRSTFELLFNEFELDISDDLPENNPLKYVTLPAQQPYTVYPQNISKDILHRFVDRMFDNFLEQTIKKIPNWKEISLIDKNGIYFPKFQSKNEKSDIRDDVSQKSDNEKQKNNDNE